ncbi:hypothetical protein ACIQ62_28730 [Streptomyces sp. NPDC096319]|uniref:hypothetical protein n=1 Tax=Streptomyces sp. NPDC096319 TaxID=3366084 RepID=UPI003820468F
MRRMAEKVFSIIEVAEQDGTWGYSDINFSEERTPGSPAPVEGPLWRQVSPVAIAGTGLAAVGSVGDDRRVYYQDLDRSVVGTAYRSSPPTGRWTGYEVFTSAVGAPSADGGSALAVTGEIGDLRVYYLDDGRRPVRLREGDQEWTYDVCADAPPGSPISPLAAVTAGQVEYVYYLDVRGHVVEASWHGAEGWSFDDLTSGTEGCPMPSPLGRLTAVRRGSASRTVYFLDETDRPVQLEHVVVAGTKKDSEGRTVWRVQRLSAYGAPAAVAGSRPVVVPTADGHPRLYYPDADRLVVEVGFNGLGWDVHHAGAEADRGAGAPAAAEGTSLAAVAGGDHRGVQVYYLGAADAGNGPDGGDGNLIELEGSGAEWTARHLGAELGLPEVATGVPSPITAIYTSGPRVYYTTVE